MNELLILQSIVIVFGQITSIDVSLEIIARLFLSIIYRFRLCLILGACSLGRYLDNSPNTRFVFKATQLKTGTITTFKGFSA